MWLAKKGVDAVGGGFPFHKMDIFTSVVEMFSLIYMNLLLLSPCNVKILFPLM